MTNDIAKGPIIAEEIATLLRSTAKDLRVERLAQVLADFIGSRWPLVVCSDGTTERADVVFARGYGAGKQEAEFAAAERERDSHVMTNLAEVLREALPVLRQVARDLPDVNSVVNLRCSKRLGVPGAWPCVLLAGHCGPHVSSNGEASTKIWDGFGRGDVEDPEIKSWGDNS